MTSPTLFDVEESEAAESVRRQGHSAGSKILIAFLVVVAMLQVFNFLFFTASSVTHIVALIAG